MRKRGLCCRSVSVHLSLYLSSSCIVSRGLKISSDFFLGPIASSYPSFGSRIPIQYVHILPVFLYGAETWSITKAIERRINVLDQWCLRRILNITWSEHVTNSEICRRTGQPLLLDIVRVRRTPQAVWPRGSGGQVPGSHPGSQSMHMAQPQELEAASRSSETYLAENGGGRPASVQPRSCIRVQEGS